MKNLRNKKIKNIYKKICYIIIISFILSLALVFIMGNKKTSSFIDVTYKTIYVSSGETLWEIARIEAANNDYYANKDIRNIVKEIKDINKLSSSNLFPGQELIIPNL